MKGGAGAFNLVDLVRFAHAFENVMDLVRVGRLEPAPALFRLMLRATDVLSDLLRAARADAALRRANERLESRVRERTSALEQQIVEREAAQAKRKAEAEGLSFLSCCMCVY